MPRTRTKKPNPTPTEVPSTPPEPSASNGVDQVLTLAEAAAYLRVKEADLRGMVGFQGFPGRRIGDEWRFLKSSLQEWLRTPIPTKSKEAVMALAGAWKDDPYVEEMLRDIYKKRGRPMTEDGE